MKEQEEFNKALVELKNKVLEVNETMELVARELNRLIEVIKN